MREASDDEDFELVDVDEPVRQRQVAATTKTGADSAPSKSSGRESGSTPKFGYGGTGARSTTWSRAPPARSRRTR